MANFLDTYRNEVVKDNPLGYWRLGDPSGTTMTAVVGNNGTYTNSPTLAQTGALLTSSDTAVKFDGSNDYASVAIDLSAQSRITVEFWANFPSYANDDKLAIEYTVNFNANAGFVVDPDNTNVTPGGFMFGVGKGDGNNWYDSFTRPTVNVWHHYVLDMNRATPVNVGYVDGVSQSLTSLTHNAATYGNFANSTLYLMSRAGTSLFCTANSLLDEVAIYSGGLSATRIKAHYAASIYQQYSGQTNQAVSRAAVR